MQVLDMNQEQLRCLNHEKTTEMKISSSYGTIGAKVWGSAGHDKLKVLAVHGWSDNAGTFDRLMPMLPLHRMHIVAIDLPGHGCSSHLPPGLPYTDLTWVVEIKRILDSLGWKEKVTILAHSMGANASLELAAVFPELIESLIMIDTIKPRVFAVERIAAEMADSIADFERHTQVLAAAPALFKLEKAVNVIVVTHTNAQLSRDAAMCLLHRAVDLRVQNGRTGLTFRRDPRLNHMVNRKFDANLLLQYLNDVQCRLLILRAKNTHPMLRCQHERRFLQHYQAHCKEFVYREVEGDHYVHLNQPENIIGHILRFLESAFQQLAQNANDQGLSEQAQQIKLE